MASPAPLGVVAHYNLLERLEPAGPGDLFRARDTRAGRTVAIRLLPAEFAPDDASRAGLLEKARGLVGLSHPNVTTLFEAGEHDGRIFLAFEYLKGQSLRAEMGGRPMNVRRAVELAIQMTDAVADAHAAGFIHGGLSPDSVVITVKGSAKIPAFELAARAGFEQGGDSAGVKLRDYDSPEEARGRDPDERSDIYSVGAVLFEMLTTRRPPHRGAAAPSASNPHVPPKLDEIVLRAVAPNPDSRYQSTVTFAAELRSVAAILDVRGGAGDEDDEHHGDSTKVGRVAVMTVIMLLLVAAIVWWFTS
ncbi:MAG TPA: serine/threonine-protein kinase [Vicinamibacterales bacterium]